MRRRTALVGLLVATALLAAFVLRQVLTTVFLALTVVVARPLYRWLVDRGVQRHVASGLTTAAVFLAVVAVAAPLGFIIYARRGDVESTIETIPDELTVPIGVIAGPVVVALLAESVRLLAREIQDGQEELPF